MGLPPTSSPDWCWDHLQAGAFNKPRALVKLNMIIHTQNTVMT